MFDVRIKRRIPTGGNAKVKTGAKKQTLDDLLGKRGPRAVVGYGAIAVFSHPVAIASWGLCRSVQAFNQVPQS